MIKNLLHAISFVLIISWIVGFIGYSAGGMIHILLGIALILIVLSFFQKREPA